MRFRIFLFGLCVLLLLIGGLAGRALAAEATFVGKLALIADAEVVKELALSDETKKKLLELIDKREQEAIAMAARLKGQPQAKVAQELAPFVAESEKQGKALLDDNQWAKLEKLKVAKDGMIGILSPDMIGKLQLTDDQKKEIAPLVEQYHKTMATGSEFLKRNARTVTERSIAKTLTDAQRGTWEQLSGVPAGGSAVAQAAAAPVAPPGPNGSAPAGPGGVNVQRAGGVAELDVSEDGQFGINFALTPWKNVIEYFARKAGCALMAEKWPPGTFTYTDPKKYTVEQVIDVFNLHLMSKGFLLVKKEKLLRLWDTGNDGPVPPEYVPEISPDDLPNRGEYELVTVYFQLDKWPPAEAEAEISKLKGPYGTLMVLSAPRKLRVTDLGGRLRWIKSMIDEVENPTGKGVRQDQRFEMIKLARLTPSEFLTNVKQLMGIAADRWETTDGNLRLSSNEIDSVVFCYGTPPRIDQVKEFARQMDGGPAKSASGSGGLVSIVEQPQFASYEVRRADPAYAENVIRTLLAGRAPDLKIQLDPKSQKLAVWGKQAEHQAVQAILRELEQNANITEVIPLRKIAPQDAVTGLNQVVGNDSTGKSSAVAGFLVAADTNNSRITISGTPNQIDRAKDWLSQMGEPLAGFSGPGGRAVGMPEDRSNVRVIPLNSRTLKYVMEQMPNVWSDTRAKVKVEKVNSLAPGATPAAEPERPAPPSKAGPGAPAAKTAPKSNAAPAPKADGKPFPRPKQPAIKPDVTLRREAEEREVAKREAEERRRAAEPVLFVSDPPVNAGAAAVDDAPVRPAEQPNVAPAPPAAVEGQTPEIGPSEILMRVTPGGIVIQSQDLDALDNFQEVLETLVQMDKKRGRRLEKFAIKYKDADVAANMLKAIIEGGATVADASSSLNLAGMLGGGGGPLGMLGNLFGSGGGNSNPAGAVNISGSSFDGTIVPDMETNVLVIMATPESLDYVESLIKEIDVAESPDPQEAPPARFIPVLHGKADAMKALVTEQFAGQIYGETANRGGQQIQPQDIAMALLTGGRGGPGGRGGGGGRGNQQSNMGEKKKIKISVAADTNSLIVTAPDHLFHDVEEFVHMVDMENVVPNATVSIVPIRNTNSDTLFTGLGSTLGTNATITRVPTINSQLLANGGRGGGANNAQQLQRGGPGQQPGQQNQQLTPQQLQQMQAFNQGRGGGNRGGGPGGFGQGGFPGGGGFQGGNRGGGGFPGGGGGGFPGGGGGFPGGGGFQGGNRGGGGGFPGGGGGGAPGGGRGGGGGFPGGGGGGAPGGGRGGGGGAPGGGRGGGGIQ